jgi:glucose/arabinose dehydrogenase
MVFEGLSQGNVTCFKKNKELFVFGIIILLVVSLLVFPSITMSRGQQRQPQLEEPLPTSAQQSLLEQPGGLSQEQDASNNTNTNTSVPIVNDSKLEVQLVTQGLDAPTSMAFIGNHGDMLILEKGGNVILFSNETKTRVSLLNFSVNEASERGLLGVAVLNNSNISKADINTISPSSLLTPTYVFFYLSEAIEGDRSQILGNRIGRFEWNDTEKSLSNGTLILDLPVTPGPNHDGGKLIADSKNRHLYAVIGDLNREGMLQNVRNGSLPDDTSVILRINPDGSPAQSNPFLNVSRSGNGYSNLSKYYAYGIRNSFGMDFDPVTGNLWDTENGPFGFDEINIVRPGFNSGWNKVMGPIERTNITPDNDLVNLLGSSSYADPVFSWARSVGVTDIEFYDSDKLGNNYTNNIFVGDFNNGNLYFFEVNENRTGLEFEHPRISDDLVASNDNQTAAVVFGTGFTNGITDIETGPDGYLYLLTFHQSMGSIFRIVPRDQ